MRKLSKRCPKGVKNLSFEVTLGPAPGPLDKISTTHYSTYAAKFTEAPFVIRDSGVVRGVIWTPPGVIWTPQGVLRTLQTPQNDPFLRAFWSPLGLVVPIKGLPMRKLSKRCPKGVKNLSFEVTWTSPGSFGQDFNYPLLYICCKFHGGPFQDPGLGSLQRGLFGPPRGSFGPPRGHLDPQTPQNVDD